MSRSVIEFVTFGPKLRTCVQLIGSVIWSLALSWCELLVDERYIKNLMLLQSFWSDDIIEFGALGMSFLLANDCILSVFYYLFFNLLHRSSISLVNCRKFL